MLFIVSVPRKLLSRRRWTYKLLDTDNIYCTLFYSSKNFDNLFWNFRKFSSIAVRYDWFNKFQWKFTLNSDFEGEMRLFSAFICVCTEYTNEPIKWTCPTWLKTISLAYNRLYSAQHSSNTRVYISDLVLLLLSADYYVANVRRNLSLSRSLPYCEAKCGSYVVWRIQRNASAVSLYWCKVTLYVNNASRHIDGDAIENYNLCTYSILP